VLDDFRCVVRQLRRRIGDDPMDIRYHPRTGHPVYDSVEN